ncbi:MAG: CRISPR-associated helicase Cas3' [Chloroflexota bacterium]|nr:CRISPR-associated helicase Cas3' [Chloroflexota bacterium]
MDSHPIAHVAEDGRTQPLYDHLIGVAQRAEKMAAEFECSEWGYLTGLWHDLGKYSRDFQRYIRATNDPEAHVEGSKPGRVDHSTAGALYALERLKTAGRILAYPVAGHHAGLADWESDRSGNAALSQRLKHPELLHTAREGGIAPDILDRSLPKEPPKPGADPALWIRLLFSCVVDADFLDTEAFLEPDKAASRGQYPRLSDLLPVFSEYMWKKQADAPDTKVNRIRAAILSRCIDRAAGPPGIYTLTVPTGGGKTLSSMAFALHHALKHNKHRIIYVIPYTSIIEQTADQFRAIFGDAVIEHQSNLDVSDPAKDNARSRLACENWDAPVVVTTSVQFFESLFASRTSRCRKLHNIVNSVVVLDEAQLLPPEFLTPILHILRELQKNYGLTLLLSTATQPALTPQPAFEFEGLPNTEEIVADPAALHDQLKRVDITIPQRWDEPRSWEDLAAELSQHPSVLCIVNRRDDCRALWAKMPAGTFHLSALMCGAHRSAKIGDIKDQLKRGIPTRVISTQLVEAGVDVDFPVVYRALAGLDSIAQAAGRCNREGLLDKGKVVVFTPPSEIPPGHLRQAAQIGQRLMAQSCADILAPDRFESFFKEFYWLQGPRRLDKHEIQADLKMSDDFRCSFRSAAEKFHLIDESGQAPVIVTYGEGADLIRQLEQGKPERWLLRRLQRYVVNLPRYVHGRLVAEGAVREVHPGMYVQGREALYDEALGFRPDKSIDYEADELVC